MSEWDLKITELEPSGVGTPALGLEPNHFNLGVGVGPVKITGAKIISQDAKGAVRETTVVALEDQECERVVFQNHLSIPVERWFEIYYQGADIKQRVGPYTISPGNTVVMKFPASDKVIYAM